MVAKVLKMEAGNIFLIVPRKKDASLVMSRYNYGGVKKPTKYGKECYIYYKFFKSFNGWKGM